MRATLRRPRKVAVVNETLASRLWPNRDAVGQRLRLDRAGEAEVQVIGVTKAAKYHHDFIL
jgi:hypothetical protein